LEEVAMSVGLYQWEKQGVEKYDKKSEKVQGKKSMKICYDNVSGNLDLSSIQAILHACHILLMYSLRHPTPLNGMIQFILQC
jgi:hypothetical protein